MLHYAVKNQWQTLLESLLDEGVNVNCTTNKGVTPLMMAGSRNHSNTVKTLLRYNADISIEDEVSISLMGMLLVIIEVQIPPIQSWVQI